MKLTFFSSYFSLQDEKALLALKTFQFALGFQVSLKEVECSDACTDLSAVAGL